MQKAYHLSVELFTKDGAGLGRAPVEVDWRPATEWASLQAMQDRVFPEGEGEYSFQLSPAWHATFGEPYMSGFDVALRLQGGVGDPLYEAAFGVDYFADQAEAAKAKLVDEGRCSLGESCLYRISAVQGNGSAARDGLALTPPGEEPSDAVWLPPAVRTGSLKERQAAATVPAKDAPSSGEIPAAHEADPALPVFIPEQVRRQALMQARGAGACEAGGVLLGHLMRDPDSAQLFLEVTAQVPATDTVADSHRLVFTAHSWAAARNAIRLRGAGEILVGWFHSHPVKHWCRNCPPAKRKKCPLSGEFFSLRDQDVHRTMFPRAFTVAMVTTLLPGDREAVSLYGWMDGRIQRRPYQVLAGQPT